MDLDNPYSAPDVDPTAPPGRTPDAVRFPMLRWAFRGAGCGASLGLALTLYVMTMPLAGRARVVRGPLIQFTDPEPALVGIVTLALAGFLVGLLIGAFMAVVPLFGPPRGPRRPMGG
jgi:hypothetical protein